MTYKAVLSVFIVFLLCFVTVEASELDYVYKLNDNISISRPCFNSDTTTGWCSNAAVCQITVADPDNNLIVSGANMTNQVSFNNITLKNISKMGVYKADMACYDNNQTGYNTFFFGVNEAGFDYRENGAIPYILGILFLLFIGFGVAAFKLEDALRLAFLLLSTLMIPVALFITSNVVKNSFMGANIINLVTWSFGISTVLYFGMVLYVLFTLLMAQKIKDNRVPTYGSPLYNAKTKREDDY